MKTSVTLVFVSLFAVVLGVYLYMGGFSGDVSEISTELMIRKASKVPDSLEPLEQNDIVNLIQIQNDLKDIKLTLVNEEGNWFIQYPVRSRAENKIVDGLAMALKLSANAKRMVNEKEWAEYGLDKPDLKVGIETNRSKKKEVLCFGSKAPIGDFVFARWVGQNQYFLMNAAVRRAFDVSMYSLRLKTLIQTPFEDIHKIHIRVRSKDYEISLHDNKWFWMEPILILGEHAQKEHVGQIFTGLSELYIKEFLDQEKKDPRAIGFSLLGDMIYVWGKSEKPEMIEIGDHIPTRDAVYARRSNSSEVFLVSYTNLSRFFQSVEALASQSTSKAGQAPVKAA